MYNGALPIQRLVDDWIIFENAGGSDDFKVAENGVSFVNFPTRKFVKDGFYKQIERKYIFSHSVQSNYVFHSYFSHLVISGMYLFVSLSRRNSICTTLTRLGINVSYGICC